MIHISDIEISRSMPHNSILHVLIFPCLIFLFHNSIPHNSIPHNSMPHNSIPHISILHIPYLIFPYLISHSLESPKYAPDKCLYTSISSIPNDLLFSISKSYESRLTVCRTCFFESLSGRGYHSSPQPVVTLKAEGGKTNHTCERGHVWRGLRVIPSSPLCQSYADYIAIPPVPKHMQTSKSPFKVIGIREWVGGQGSACSIQD